jgi:hypothetical protein
MGNELDGLHAAKRAVGVEVIGYGYAFEQRRKGLTCRAKKAMRDSSFRERKKARKTNHGMDRLFRLGLAGAVAPGLGCKGGGVSESM